MKAEIATMTDAEVMDEIHDRQLGMTERLFDALESELRLRAAVLGWTGNPLQQPPRSVLASIRSVMDADDKRTRECDAQRALAGGAK